MKRKIRFNLLSFYRCIVTLHINPWCCFEFARSRGCELFAPFNSSNKKRAVRIDATRWRSSSGSTAFRDFTSGLIRFPERTGRSFVFRRNLQRIWEDLHHRDRSLSKREDRRAVPRSPVRICADSQISVWRKNVSG